MREYTPMIVRARTVVTQDDAPEAPAHGAPADAMAVAGEWIVATGPMAELRERFPAAEIIDFGSATIAPGFNDAHTHLAVATQDALHLDLSASAVPTRTDLLQALAAQASVSAPGCWIRGSRYDEQKTGRVRRGELDAVVPDHPVLLVHVAGHWGVANSAALDRLGIREDSADPPGGAYTRDGQGRLDGQLVERALMGLTASTDEDDERTLPASSADDLRAGLEKVVARWNAAGITSVCDALVAPADVRLFERARHDGALRLRVGMLLDVAYYDRARDLGIGSGFGDNWLRFVGVKMFVDGAIGGRTCLLSGRIDADHHALQITSTPDLREAIARVHGDGNRVAVHANGDTAIEIALDAFETAERTLGRARLPHRIEHCSLVDDDILARMRSLGIVAVPFAGYPAYHGGALTQWYGPERVSRMFAHRSFLDAGVAVAASSDHPCGPYEPLVGLQSLVTRTGMDDGEPVGPVQRVSAAEALRIFTLGSAAASGDDAIKGRLAPGYLADFVVLDADPLTIDPAGIASIGVVATYVGGREVFARE